VLANRRFWIGAAVTAAFLLLLFWQIDVGEMLSALGQANYVYIVPGVLIYFVSLYFRAFRWRFLLGSFAELRTWRLYPVVLVGYMANNLVPMRLGEVARSYFLSTREPVRGSTALATIIVERVFDGLALLSLLALAGLALPIGDLIARTSDAVRLVPGVVVAVFVLPFIVALALMALAALYPDRMREFMALFVRRLPARFQERVMALLERFLIGFAGLHRPRRLATALLLSLPIWLAEAAMYFVIGIGFGLYDAFDGFMHAAAAILMVTALSNLATSLPSSQGSVGPFEFFASITLVGLGVDGGTASAYAVVLHAALLLPPVVAGLAYLASRSVSLGQLTRGAAPTPAKDKSA